MKKTYSIVLLLFSVLLSTTLFAQQEKQFTLEELIPGGDKFWDYYPYISEQFHWQGDELIVVKGDSAFKVNPTKPESKTFYFRFADLGEKVNRVQFNDAHTIRYFTRSGMGIYDLNKKQSIAQFTYPENGANHQISPNHQHMAFTEGNNLYLLDGKGKKTAISNEENKAIVYGLSVHQNEFGIDGGIFWSPNGSKLAFYRMDESMVTDYPLVDFSARTAKLKARRYPMAGMASHHVTVGVYDLGTGKTVYLKTGEPLEHFLTNVAWNPEGTHIYIAELNREQNHMKLNRYDAVSGSLDQTLFEEKHPKYVEPQNPVLFLPGNSKQFIWQSNRDGYNHLYLYDTTGKLLKQLTKGEWEVTEVVGFDAKAQHLFFVSTNPTPMDRHVWSVAIKNAKLTRHTQAEGMHSAQVSASAGYIVDRYSAHNNPGEIALINTKNKKITTLVSARNPYDGYAVPQVESGTLKAADGTSDLYYRMVKPTDFDPAKKYPVAIYVYGGPHSQMVQNRWRYGSGGWEMYMAQKGYIVFVVDNRGTSYRGRDFENVTHRNLGVEESKDQMKGVEFLKSLPYVDAERMGIHGWSFGGFMTITMLLNYPDVFKVGVAGGPVIDWKYYEIMYGERYMDTPQENEEGYKQTSLLNKADQLKARLLIIHGDEDPVVVPQHSLQFLKASIKAGTHPDFFIYPGHEHNMSGKDRVHLHEHITRYFDDFCK